MRLTRAVEIKGNVTATEDLTIEGTVRGTIAVQDHTLTVGFGAKVEAGIFARYIVVEGTVHGDVTATEKVTILDKASIHGHIVAPRVDVVAGADIGGRIDVKPALASAIGGEPQSGRRRALKMQIGQRLASTARSAGAVRR